MMDMFVNNFLKFMFFSCEASSTFCNLTNSLMDRQLCCLHLNTLDTLCNFRSLEEHLGGILGTSWVKLKTGLGNRKQNYLNRKWNYFSLFQILTKKLILQKFYHLVREFQNLFWKQEIELIKQEIELYKQEMELFLPLPGPGTLDVYFSLSTSLNR